MCNIYVFVQEHQDWLCRIAVTRCCATQENDGGNKSRKRGAPAKTTGRRACKAPKSKASNKDTASVRFCFWAFAT